MNKFFISTLAGLTAAFGVASGEDYNVNLTPQGIPGAVPQLNNAPTGGTAARPSRPSSNSKSRIRWARSTSSATTPTPTC